MKVQRFVGSTSGETLDHVRNALGPNAMILSNRSIEEGIEILACSEKDFKDVVQRHEPELVNIEKKTFIRQQPPIIINTSPSPAFDMSDFMGEIRSIRDSLQAQISELSWGKLQEQNPIKKTDIANLIQLYGGKNQEEALDNIKKMKNFQPSSFGNKEPL